MKLNQKRNPDIRPKYQDFLYTKPCTGNIQIEEIIGYSEDIIRFWVDMKYKVIVWKARLWILQHIKRIVI